MAQKRKIGSHRGGSLELSAILSAIGDGQPITSTLRDMSISELLEGLKSANLHEIAKPIFILAAASAMLDEIKNSDSSLLLKKLYSFPDIQKAIGGKRESFIVKNRISEQDLLLLTKIVDGIPLKCFEEEASLSPSTANKKIRRLTHRLGLKKRTQLIFVAGWMRLISPELECLKPDET